MELNQLKKQFREEIPSFAQKAHAFAAGEVDRKAYKGFSGGFGSYAQRGETGNMLRLRLPGGRVTKQQLGFIADSIRAYDVKRLKITTCQTIQLHDLTADTVAELMEKAVDVDIITRGGGGDHPRNVMVSPLSGLREGEPFDVRPAAEAAGKYMLARMYQGLHMPRKLKVAFSNSEENEVHATFRDLGFVARPDGTFDVYCAGGLGPNPRLGVLVDSEVRPQDVAYDIEAMIRLFCKYGNYENRAKARTRYLQESLGREGLKEKFSEELAAAKEQGGLELVLEPWQPTKKADGALTLPMARVTAQKQPGLYAVSYHPVGGMLAPERVCALYEAVRELEQVELRLCADGGLYVVNLSAREVPVVLEATGDGAATRFEASTSCIGAATCQQGVRDSQQLLAACVQAVREAGLKDGSLPRIAVSGCPSSCSAHQAAGLGFVGGVKVIDKVAHPAFTLFVGGDARQGEETLGTAVCSMLQAEIPAFLVELGRTVEASGEDYDQWIVSRGEELKAIAAKYAK